MSDRLKVNLAKYGTSTGISLAMIWFYCSSRNVFSTSGAELWRHLCDAFTIPGLTLVMIGFLVMIANEGFFDMFSYAFSKALGVFIPGRGFSEKHEKYYDYVQRKKEKRATGFGFLFVVGGILMAFALLFMFLFYRTYNA